MTQGCWTTEDKIKRIVKLREEENLSFKNIGARLCIPHTTVCRVYKKYKREVENDNHSLDS